MAGSTRCSAQPRFFFPYAGLEWIRPWPASACTCISRRSALLALAIIVGCWTRTSTALFALGFTWAHLIDKTNYLNHYYLVSVLAALMALLPLGVAGSVDARPRPRAPPTGAGVDGVGAARAARARLLLRRRRQAERRLAVRTRSRSASGSRRAATLPLLGPLLERRGSRTRSAGPGVAFDLGIVPLLALAPDARRVAYGLVVVFHVLTSVLFPIGIFPWLMIVADADLLRSELAAPSGSDAAGRQCAAALAPGGATLRAAAHGRARAPPAAADADPAPGVRRERRRRLDRARLSLRVARDGDGEGGNRDVPPPRSRDRRSLDRRPARRAHRVFRPA